jgi:hypothetical protein
MRAMRIALCMLLVAACAAESKGPEDELPAEGKLDSFAKPTDHGAIAFATSQRGTLSATAKYHTWTFSLSGDASIHAFTSRIPHEKTLDTVLYLYKKTPTGTWGSYIARNDDATSSTKLSSLTRSLGAGDYRVLVKGYVDTVKGPFGVQVDCTGAGCAAPSVMCVFGENQDDFQNGANPNLLQNKHTYSSVAQLHADNLGPIFDQRIIEALHQSAHTDVTTIEEAFEAADQSQIDVVYVYDLLGAREFIAIEYGSGDNPYGAIFAGRTGPMVAALKDSDVAQCTVPVQTCDLHQNLGDLRQDPTWAQVSLQTLTSASQLSGTQAQDALAAIRVAYTDATSLADGFSKIDQGQLDLYVLQKGSTRVEMYLYGAGDNPYGAIFLAGSTTLAAEIHDTDFYACSLLH